MSDGVACSPQWSQAVMNAQCCRKSGQVSCWVSTEWGTAMSEESVTKTKGKQACSVHMLSPLKIFLFKKIPIEKNKFLFLSKLYVQAIIYKKCLINIFSISHLVIIRTHKMIIELNYWSKHWRWSNKIVWAICDIWINYTIITIVKRLYQLSCVILVSVPGFRHE